LNARSAAFLMVRRLLVQVNVESNWGFMRRKNESPDYKRTNQRAA
jgi:hypothetical protein